MAASLVCQQILERRPWSLPARFAWGTLDSLLLLVVLLFIADGAASPIIVGYPLVIVASGLWFRVRYVWFMTVLSLISYGVLIVDFYRWRPQLHDDLTAGLDRHVLFIVSLLLLAAIVAYLVQRVRMLSSFYGQKLP
jgi:serine/threonine-protein kinase